MKCKNDLICLNGIAETSNKGVSQTLEFYYKMIEGSKYRSGVSSLFALNEILISIPTGIGFKQFSPFFEVFNEKIGQLIATGIMNKWDNKSYPKKIDDIGPQVLTVDHLRLGFMACLIPLGLATIFFFMEIFVSAMFKRNQRVGLRSFPIKPFNVRRKSRIHIG